MSQFRVWCDGCIAIASHRIASDQPKNHVRDVLTLAHSLQQIVCQPLIGLLGR